MHTAAAPKYLTTAELTERAIVSDGMPISGVAISLVVPFSAGDAPLAVMFLRGFKYDDGVFKLTMPYESRLLNPYTGALVRIIQSSEPHRVVVADEGPRSAERERLIETWGNLQDGLAPAFYAGEKRVPDRLARLASDYRDAFPKLVGRNSIAAYHEAAPSWCAWVDI